MRPIIQYVFDDTKQPSTVEHEGVLVLGLALQFAAHSTAHEGVPLSAFATLARSALQLGQMRVYVNATFECVGYVIWAMLTPDVEDAYIAGQSRLLADWEFSDGTSPWILDFAVMPGMLSKVLQDLRDVVFKEHEHVTYHRFKGQHRLCKRISRSTRSSFIAAGR